MQNDDFLIEAFIYVLADLKDHFLTPQLEELSHVWDIDLCSENILDILYGPLFKIQRLEMNDADYRRKLKIRLHKIAIKKPSLDELGRVAEKVIGYPPDIIKRNDTENATYDIHYIIPSDFPPFLLDDLNDLAGMGIRVNSSYELAAQTGTNATTESNNPTGNENAIIDTVESVIITGG
jgi:hypothetical protein